MRCKFCGWENPNDRTSCEKCNQPLGMGVNTHSNDGGNDSRLTDRRVTPNETGFQPKKTVRENNGLKEESFSSSLVVCQHCGYEINEKTDYCPNCGNSLLDKSSTPEKPIDYKQTIPANFSARFNQGEKKNFKLSLVSNEGEILNSVDFEGEDIILNRDNLDKENLTITSKEQALVRFDNGKWSIEDRSDLKSTFVQAAKPMELHNGDLILLGDKLFRFETE